MKFFCAFEKYPYFARKVKTTLGIVAVLLLLVTLANCQQTYHQIQLRTRSARDLYPAALKKAHGWRSDAYLQYIDVDILPRDDYTHPVLVCFHFESPSDGHYSLSITFQGDLDEPEIKQFFHETALSVHNPIKSEDWSLDSTDILPIVQDNGGNEFLARHNSETTLMVLYLERQPIAPGALLKWRASYFDKVTGDGLTVTLDPQTGKVIGTEKSTTR
jgi:hypothetical protein